jgi:hypothetical protein
MRILLDARDLINLFEHERPATVRAFDTYLRACEHQIVLSSTNVRELSSPLSAGVQFLQLRPILQSLEQPPHLYIKEVTIVALEIQAAVNAFNQGTQFESPSPYVPRWDYTLLSFPGRSRPAVENWIDFRLDEIIYHIHRTRPDVFAPPRQHLPALEALFEKDRAAFRAGKAPARQHFVRSIKNHAATHRINLPNGREDEFAVWVYANPNRCPGLRLNHEVYRALVANYADTPEVADFSDLAHVFAIPYVDVATLDRRMRHYCRSGARKMVRFGSANNYEDHVEPDVTSIMRRYCAPIQ